MNKIEEFLEKLPHDLSLHKNDPNIFYELITKTQNIIRERETLIYILGDCASYMAHQQSEANTYRQPTPQFDYDLTLEFIRKSDTEINKIVEG